VALMLLDSLLQNTAFAHLRTELQLGYVVQGGASLMESHVEYLNVLVQGTLKNADEQEAAIENVLLNMMPASLQELTEDEFEGLRQATLDSLSQNPSGPSEEVSHFWMHVANGVGCFGLRETLRDYLTDNVTSKELLIETYSRLIEPTSEGVRRKISVKLFAKPKDATEQPERGPLKDAKEMWKAQGLEGKMLDLMSAEYQQTKVISKVDSAAHRELVNEGSYYPQTFACEPQELEPQLPQTGKAEPKKRLRKSAKLAPVDAPSLIQRFVKLHEPLEGNVC